MFDVLVYLYENYHHPEVCPEPVELAKSLSEIGFKEAEIRDALTWLTELAARTQGFSSRKPDERAFPASAHRVYAPQEYAALGVEAIGFIESLANAGVLKPIEREIAIERGLAANESPLTLEKLRIVVLMVLWSQGDDPDALLLDALFPDDDGSEPRLPH
ncbi:MAG: hypothetical protein H6R01_567 [Burkholderiaceae bacterium]|nr:hypothetical protein [Burkholderiaceae bacterium]